MSGIQQNRSETGIPRCYEGNHIFDIAEIIDRTMPKVVFLENVENLVSHDKGQTFKTIINTLENELNYHVIGVKKDKNGELVYDKNHS